MKSIFIFLIAYLPMQLLAQKFIIDTPTIIKYGLNFDTSKFIQNEDLFVVRNVFFSNSGMPFANVKLGGTCNIQIFSKVNGAIIIEKIIEGKNIDTNKHRINAKKFEYICGLKHYMIVNPIANTFVGNNYCIGEASVEIVYIKNKKRKSFKVNEVKIVWPLVEVNYNREYIDKWKFLYNQQ